MNQGTKLPDEFAELQKFVAVWARVTVDERIDSRCTSSMADIRAFYDAAICRATDIVAYLERYKLDDMPESAACLMQLLLGLAHASIAVEIQGQPLPPKTTYPLRVHLVSGVAPFG